MFCLKTRLIIKVSKPNFVSFETSEYVKLGYGESIQQRGQQCAAVDDEGYRRRYADGQVASRDADPATELLSEVAGTREANLLSYHATARRSSPRRIIRFRPDARGPPRPDLRLPGRTVRASSPPGCVDHQPADGLVEGHLDRSSETYS